MLSRKPFLKKEHLDLTEYGIDPHYINPSTVVMQSDKFISVRHKEDNVPYITMIDVNKAVKITKLQVGVDLIVMNPVKRIFVAKIDNSFGIFNVDTYSKITSHTMPEDVVFCKWISPSTLAIVTDTTVHHWTITEQSHPVKIFERRLELRDRKIVDYQVDSRQLCNLLIADPIFDGDLKGLAQFYFHEDRTSFTFPAYTAVFTEFTMEGNDEPTPLLCYCLKDGEIGRIVVLQIGMDIDKNQTFPVKTGEFDFFNENGDDYPVAMHVSSKLNVVYMISRYDYVYVFDIESAATIIITRMNNEIIITSAPHESSGGIICIDWKGNVMSGSICEESIMSYVRININDPQVIMRMAINNNLPGVEDLFIACFNELFESKQYGEAAKIASLAPKDILRTLGTMLKFQAAHATPKEASPLLQYLNVLLEQGRLGKIESLELSRIAIIQGNKHLVEKWFKEGRLKCSEELGNLVKQVDPAMARSIFTKANLHEKVILSFVEAGEIHKIIPYAKSVSYVPDYLALLSYMSFINPQWGISFAVMLAQGEQPIFTVAEIVDYISTQTKRHELLISMKFNNFEQK